MTHAIVHTIGVTIYLHMRVFIKERVSEVIDPGQEEMQQTDDSEGDGRTNQTSRPVLSQLLVVNKFTTI